MTASHLPGPFAAGGLVRCREAPFPPRLQRSDRPPYLPRLSVTDQTTDPMVNSAPITGSMSDACPAQTPSSQQPTFRAIAWLASWRYR